MNKPRFEKVDEHNIKIIVEKATEVSLNNKEGLLKQKTQIEETLKNIEEILTEAKKLGITPKEKVKI